MLKKEEKIYYLKKKKFIKDPDPNKHVRIRNTARAANNNRLWQGVYYCCAQLGNPFLFRYAVGLESKPENI